MNEPSTCVSILAVHGEKPTTDQLESFWRQTLDRARKESFEARVEKGEAPTRVAASHSTNGKVDRTRPLCAYPQVARYTGTGSTDEAANFTCRLP